MAEQDTDKSVTSTSGDDADLALLRGERAPDPTSAEEKAFVVLARRLRHSFEAEIASLDQDKLAELERRTIERARESMAQVAGRRPVGGSGSSLWSRLGDWLRGPVSMPVLAGALTIAIAVGVVWTLAPPGPSSPTGALRPDYGSPVQVLRASDPADLAERLAADIERSGATVTAGRAGPDGAWLLTVRVPRQPSAALQRIGVAHGLSWRGGDVQKIRIERADR
jgi:hypothetical protein